MCLTGFKGKGYSPEFINNLRAITGRLRGPDGDNTGITVVRGPDDVCAKCPHLVDDTCDFGGKVEQLDERHAKALDMKEGERLTWHEAKKRIAGGIDDSTFDHVCESCYWKFFGACKSALHALHKTTLPLATFLLAATGAWTAFAAQPQSGTAIEPLPADAARVALMKKSKSKTARVVKKAMDAIDAKKFGTARAAARQIQSDPEFADYGLWLDAHSRRLEAMEAVAEKKNRTAAGLGARVATLLIKITAQMPHSPFLKKVPEEIALAELVEADALAAKRRATQAIGFYERAFARLGTFEKVLPGNLAGFSVSCNAIKGRKASRVQTESCRAWLTKFLTIYSKGSEELSALASNWEEAREAVRPLAVPATFTQNYKAPDLDQTSFDTAIGLYLDGKYSKAIKAMQQFVDEYPRSIHALRARFWLGQALTQEQEHERAKKVYDSLVKESPLSYYGLLASISIAQDIGKLISDKFPDVQSSDPALMPADLMHLRRAEKLVAEGATTAAALELREMRPRDYAASPTLLYIAMLANDSCNHTLSFQLLTDLFRRNHAGILTLFGLKLIFPSTFLTEIRKQAAEQKIDPLLMLSLVKQESAFNAGAVSSSGALGLSQLMPFTATDTEPGVARAEILDPETNLRIGAKYLRKMLVRFNGNIALSLAAYNAGPAAVDRWVRDGRSSRGLLEFIEQIPYKETREYVAGIIRNYFWYTKLMSGEAPKSLGMFWNVYGPPVTPAEGTAPPTPQI